MLSFSMLKSLCVIPDAMIRFSTTNILIAALLAVAPANAGGPLDDDDGDSIVNRMDNCVLAANASQTDTDGDGWGNRCDADYDNDGTVNSADLGIMKAAFFETDANVDLNDDGVVNAQDLGILKTLFFQAPGPAGFATWISTSDGDWDEAANWFPAAVPPPQAHVTIDPPTEITVSFPRAAGFTPAEFSVASITNSQSLVVRVGTLVVNGALLSAGSLTLFGDRLEVNGEVVVEGEFVLGAGTLANATILPNTQNEPITPIGPGSVTLENTVLVADLLISNGVQTRVAGGMTMADSEIVLASDFSFTDLRFNGEQTLGGTGRIVFGGTTTADFTNRIYTWNSLEGLTIGPGITLETATAGGQVSAKRLHGSVISRLPGRRVELSGEWSVDGSISVGEFSTVDYFVNGEFDMTPAASIDIDVGPASNGSLTFYNASLAGNLNVALVNGAGPSPCEFVDIFSYVSATGGFDAINGPDFAGETFDLILLEDIGRLITPGPECIYEVTRLPGNVETASSESVFNLAENGNDNSPISWWCAEIDDAAPHLTVELMSDATVYEIEVGTDVAVSNQFLSGRLRLLDASDNELYNSGTLAIVDGDVLHDVVPNTPSVRKIVFEGETWVGPNQPCVGEINARGTAP